MAQKGGLASILAFLVWLVGIIVSLSVGFAMVNGILSLPSWLGGATVAGVAGWVVVVFTIVSLVLAIINKLS